MKGEFLWNLGLILVFVGFAISIVAVVLFALSGLKGKKAKEKVGGGGVVIIGPFPIVFGTDKESVKILLFLSIVLVVLLLVFVMFSNYILR